MKQPPLKMLSIGSATQDVFLIGGDLFKPEREDGIDYEHFRLGAKLELEDVVFTTGGNAMNAATTFARQGLHSEFMGVVGTDPAGEAVLRVLDDEGISTRYVKQSDAYKTAYSTILLAPNGERTILTYHGTRLRADGSDLNLLAIADVDWLYVSSLGSIQLLGRVFALAARNGVKVAFNPSSRELENPEKLRPILDDVTILLANKEEMQQIAEGKTAEELARHGNNLVPIVVVSDGPNGVVAADGQKLVKAGVYDDVKVVDRLGAGDAFGSGFTAMIAKGKGLEDAITFASANATSVVTKVGAKAGILHKGAPVHGMPLTVSGL